MPPSSVMMVFGIAMRNATAAPHSRRTRLVASVSMLLLVGDFGEPGRVRVLFVAGLPALLAAALLLHLGAAVRACLLPGLDLFAALGARGLAGDVLHVLGL